MEIIYWTTLKTRHFEVLSSARRDILFNYLLFLFFFYNMNEITWSIYYMLNILFFQKLNQNYSITICWAYIKWHISKVVHYVYV